MTTREDILSLDDCPFCGLEPMLLETREVGGSAQQFMIACYQCGIEMGSEDREDLVETWSRRAAPTPHAAEALEKDRITDRLLRFDPALMRAADTRAILLEAAAHIVELRAKNSHLHSKLLLSAPPAVEVPGQEPVAYMGRGLLEYLNKPGVEYLNCCAYTKAGIWMLDEDQRVPVYAAPPTYADAEAKGFEKCRAAALTVLANRRALLNQQFEVIDIGREDTIFRICEDAIRSLASPAPKGET